MADKVGTAGQGEPLETAGAVNMRGKEERREGKSGRKKNKNHLLGTND